MTAGIPSSGKARADHYEWITEYLAARGLTGTVRAMMSLVSASLAACLLALLLSADGPRGVVPVVMMCTALGGGIAGTLLWAARWPTRRQSTAYAVISNSSVALACLSYPNAQGALTGCIAFAIMGAYIAFFHSTALVLYNFALAAVVAVIAAARVIGEGHTALALVDLFLVLQINIVMPVAIHVLIRALGVDLEQADRDPLTGLLNRRSFQHQTAKLLATTSRPHLLVAMVDLDDFKRINDTQGHQAGDDALVAVSRALGHAVLDTSAIIARIGGEEFVVAAASRTDVPALLSRRICDAIAELPVPITASVGTASAEIRVLRGDDGEVKERIERLVVLADEAMYRAKRDGGNRFQHAG